MRAPQPTAQHTTQNTTTQHTTQHTTAQHKEKRKAGSNINGSRRRQTCEKSTGENHLKREKSKKKFISSLCTAAVNCASMIIWHLQKLRIYDHKKCANVIKTFWLQKNCANIITKNYTNKSENMVKTIWHQNKLSKIIKTLGW